ncbi:hypothetical protein BH11PSE3_BH11PSE3_29600 [soil metagenome]
MGWCGFGAFSAVCLFVFSSGASAADITVRSRPASPPSLSPTRLASVIAEPALIRLSGPLRRGDADAVRTLLTRLKADSTEATPGPLATVELSSLGGDLGEGLAIGTLFRDYDVATIVRRNDVCLSACALAFLGGTSSHEGTERGMDQRIELGARLTFHNFFLNADSAESPTPDDPVKSRKHGFMEARAATASLLYYAADLGIDPKFIASLMAKPPEELTNIDTAQEFIALKICPADLAPPAASLAEQALNICNNSTGWIDPAHLQDVRALPPQQAKRYMLENIQQNMSSQKVNGALSEQLASYSVMRAERSIDALYADLRAAGVRLPEIVGPVFEVSGYRLAGRDMQCFVSLSPTDPNRYQVAIRRPTKWSHPNWAAPAECRGLYRHDRNAVINPSSEARPQQSEAGERGAVARRRDL